MNFKFFIYSAAAIVFVTADKVSDCKAALAGKQINKWENLEAKVSNLNAAASKFTTYGNKVKTMLGETDAAKKAAEKDDLIMSCDAFTTVIIQIGNNLNDIDRFIKAGCVEGLNKHGSFDGDVSMFIGARSALAHTCKTNPTGFAGYNIPDAAAKLTAVINSLSQAKLVAEHTMLKRSFISRVFHFLH